MPPSSNDDEVIKLRIAVGTLQAEMVAARASFQGELLSIKDGIKLLVTQYEFGPVKLLVYGLAASVGAGVIGAVLSKVLIK